MRDFLTITHIAGGATVLLTGLIIMFLKKGDRKHTLLGWIYSVSMWMVCASAFSIIAFYRFSFFLMVIGVLTFYSTFVGIRVTRRRKDGNAFWYDWAVSVIVCAFGIGLLGYAVHLLVSLKQFHILIVLSSIFGVFTFRSGFEDLKKFYLRDLKNRSWWVSQHISAMGGSYIAAVTAFAVQNGNVFLPDNSWHWTLWILPGIIGGMIISKVIRKMENKRVAPI